MPLFIYIKSFKRIEMDTAHSVASMVLYNVFFSCLATIVMATRQIDDILFKEVCCKQLADFNFLFLSC